MGGKTEMCNLRQTAEAYYDSCNARERSLFHKFYNLINPDERQQVSFELFREFMRKGYESNFCSRDFFNDLDRDESGGLDFFEVMTLYYIIKSGRPFCGQCGSLITGLYFTCTTCFNDPTKHFCVCLDCFKGGFEHRHGPEKFLDNFALLEQMRELSPLASDDSRENNRNRELLPSSSSIHQTNWNSGRDGSDAAAASLLALVPANIREPLTTAYRVYQATVSFKNYLSGCTIM